MPGCTCCPVASLRGPLQTHASVWPLVRPTVVYHAAEPFARSSQLTTVLSELSRIAKERTETDNGSLQCVFACMGLPNFCCASPESAALLAVGAAPAQISFRRSCSLTEMMQCSKRARHQDTAGRRAPEGLSVFI